MASIVGPDAEMIRSISSVASEIARRSGVEPAASTRRSAAPIAAASGPGSSGSASSRKGPGDRQAGKRERGLGFATSRRQHLEPALETLFDARLPQGGLPDAGLALDHQRARALRDVIEEAGDPPELGLATDDRFRPWGQGATSRSTS